MQELKAFMSFFSISMVMGPSVVRQTGWLFSLFEILTAETALKKTNVSLFQSAFNLIENAVCPKELSPEILHTFIDKIYIYNPNPVNDKTTYKIEIYLKHADNKF